MEEVYVNAFAKINLFLDVVSKEKNSYHNIESVMQTVSLCDEIMISVDRKALETSINVNCNSSFAPSGKDNIVYRAAQAFLDRNNLKAKVNINLVKNIPSPAGVGGGSADAAAILRGLNEIFNEMYAKELEDLAMDIGSDVPFCIFGGTQKVQGTGNILTPMPDLKKCCFVLGFVNDKLETPNAYKELDEIYDNFETPHGTDGKSMREFDKYLSENKVENICKNLYNIFEQPAVKHCPKISFAKEILNRCDAKGTLMSGSGPCVFGFFDNFNQAQKAQVELLMNGIFAKVCNPVSRYME